MPLSNLPPVNSAFTMLIARPLRLDLPVGKIRLTGFGGSVEVFGNMLQLWLAMALWILQIWFGVRRVSNLPFRIALPSSRWLPLVLLTLKLKC